MTDPTRDAGRWETVTCHDFDGMTELDATITTVLDVRRPDRPLYDTVNVEPAERFLASAGDADASVAFRIADRTVRVFADGRVQLRRPDPLE